MSLCFILFWRYDCLGHGRCIDLFAVGALVSFVGAFEQPLQTLSIDSVVNIALSAAEMENIAGSRSLMVVCDCSVSAIVRCCRLHRPYSLSYSCIATCSLPLALSREFMIAGHVFQCIEHIG